nr:immunoglobulin heavy chain junction region [Macaca mulatta]MOV52955.1 immunoglobulin heavy chain junction region [Macaca mulatta]
CARGYWGDYYDVGGSW